MKKKRLLLYSGLIVCFILIHISNSDAQWIDKGEYKELTASDTTILQFLTPKNDTCFYTVDARHNYRKFDYNGNLLYEKKLNNIDSVDYSCVSSDGKSVIYHKKFQTGYNYDVYWKYKVKILDIETDIELRNNIFDLLKYSGGSSGSCDLPTIDYKSEIQKLLFSYGLSYDWSYGAQTHESGISGHVNILDFINAKNDDVINGEPISVTYNEDLNILAGVLFSSQSNTEGSTHTTTKSIFTKSFFYFDKARKIYFDLARQYNDYLDNTKNYAYGVLPKWIRLSNSDSSVIGINDSLLIDYKVFDNNNYQSNSCYLKSSPLDLQLSLLDNYYIFLMKDSKINIMERTQKIILEEFSFNDSVAHSKLRISSDGTGIMTSGGNKLYLYEPVYFSDQLHSLFSIKSTNVHQYDTVQFLNASTGNPEEYFWDFGDSTYSNEKNPLHIYSTPGIYTVRLVVKKGNLSDWLVKTDYIIVNPELKADFEATLTNGLPPLIVNFIDKSLGNINRWSWDFGDGSKDTTRNPEHVYVNPGIYPVRLIISDTVSSDTLTKWDYINVEQSAITDSSILSEKIMWINNVNINKTEGFEIVNGNYLVEILSGRNIKLMMLDRNYDTLWTKNLFNGPNYSPIRKSKNGNLYVAGNLEDKLNVNSVNKVDTAGNITNLLSYPGTHVFDYYASDTTIAIYSNFNRPSYVELYIYNLETKIANGGGFYYMNGSTSYTYSGKLDHYYDGYYFYALNYVKYPDKDAFLQLYIMFTETKPDRLNGRLGSERTKRTIVTDFKVVNDNNYLSIEDSVLIISRRFSGDINFSGLLPNVKFYSTAVLKDSTFAACGSKNGYCWYAILNVQGEILEEHEITNRIGSFSSISLNSDSSFLLVGSLYKNSFESLYNTAKSHSNMMLSDIYSGLFICKTKPNPLMSIKEANVLPDEIKIYPNPSEGEFAINNLTIKYQAIIHIS